VIGDAADVLLSIDRERGLILYAGSWFRGSIYRVLEMSDVSFDEELSPDSFETVPIHGLDWTNLRENPAD
jgi:hypothetical protein